MPLPGSMEPVVNVSYVYRVSGITLFRSVLL